MGLFAFLVFPGFLFAGALGLAASWVDRKVTARLQWRVGPPLAQPVYDLVKLLGKEILLPRGGNHFLFLLAPILGMVAATIVSAMLWSADLWGRSFVGDAIVTVYLLMVPSLSVMLGALASGNPLAAMGASREMKMMVAYELPFLACLATVILKADGSLSLARIMEQPAALSISGALALVISLLCVQAKLAFVPFDLSEAETEILGGTTVEYSGAPLAIFRFTQAVLLVTLPLFLSMLFLGGLRFSGLGILWAIVKLVVILLLVIVVKNANPRIRIDQAVRFFWLGLAPLAALSFALALLGRILDVPWL
jgi:NADH-quinone oxidoreductase subunit H